MVNSRKKIIYITSISAICLSGLGLASYYIATSFNAPTTNSLQAQYYGATAGLNVPYDINSNLSFNDWLLINMPSKMVVNTNNKTIELFAPTINDSGAGTVQFCYAQYEPTANNGYSTKFLTPKSNISESLLLNTSSITIPTSTTQSFVSKNYEDKWISNFTLNQSPTDTSKYLTNYKNYSLEKTILASLPTGNLLNHTYTVSENSTVIYTQNVYGITENIKNLSGVVVARRTFSIQITNKDKTISLVVKLTQDPNNLKTYNIKYTNNGVDVTNYISYSSIWDVNSGIHLPKDINMFGLFDFVPHF